MDINKKGLEASTPNQKNITASLGKELPLGLNGTTSFFFCQPFDFTQGKGGKNGY